MLVHAAAQPIDYFLGDVGVIHPLGIHGITDRRRESSDVRSYLAQRLKTFLRAMTGGATALAILFQLLTEYASNHAPGEG